MNGSSIKVRHAHGVSTPTTLNRDAAAHALHLLSQARLWLGHATTQSRMRADTLHRKAFDSLTFSLEAGARAFTIPSKLGGTSKHQDAIRRLYDLSPLSGHRLDVQENGEELVVSFHDLTLGIVQDKHVPWLRPLLPYGVPLHFLTVTGADREEGGYLGVNVAIARTGAAIERYMNTGGDGVAEPSASLLLLEDVYLWRDRAGTPHASVPHVVRRSSSGIAWGYDCAGASDLAYSILRRFTDPGTAVRLCPAFTASVVAVFPEEGGHLRGTTIVAWLARYGA